jgi:hypothetical protein
MEGKRLMARKRHKPMTPEQVAIQCAERRAAEREAARRLEYGVNDEALALPANDEVRVVRDKRKGGVQTAHRDDVFDRLLRADGQMRAIRRLEQDIAEQHGEAYREGQRVHVDTSQYPPGQNINEAAIKAGKRVAAVKAKLGARCWILLHDLIRRSVVGFPANDGLTEGEAHRQRVERKDSNPFDWRRVVLHLTGEENEQAQGARVRAACTDLADAYADIDHGSRSKPRADDVVAA